MASRLQDVILRGLAAARPLATAVAPGTLYYSTDTAVTERSNGTIWETYTDASGGGGGPHAATHSSGAADPVTVTNLAGYPGGTTTFLRADHTFATPTSTPLAHATTHSSGGTDPVTVTNLAGYPGGTTNFLRADGTFATPPAGGGGITALTTDVTASGPGSAVATIAADAVTYAKMQNISAASLLLGRGSASGSGDPQEITLGTNLAMSGTTLNATGGGGGITALTGDVTASGTGSVAATIANDAVTYAKMQNVSAGVKLLGRGSDADTVLLIGAETAVSDESGSVHPITLNGSAARTTAQFKYGTASITFSGVSDWLTTPDSADYTFGVGNFTVESWCRFVTKQDSQAIMGQWGPGGQSWYIYIVSGQLTFTHSAGLNVQAAFVPTLGQWYHIAVDRSGNTLRVYVDGVVIATNSSFTYTLIDSTEPLVIGAIGTGSLFGGFNYNGQMDEIRISKGIARYAGAFTAPTTAFPRNGGDPEEVSLGTGLTLSGTVLSAPVPSAPPLHASTHSSGNSDAISITSLAGYPGGTTNFLRADSSFAAPSRTSVLGITVDGGGSVITTGLKGYLEVPFACTIQAATLLADVAGAVVFDVWKQTYASFPPVVGNTITASAKPTITATNQKSQDATLSGWTTTVNAGDILAFNVDSVTTIKRVTLTLKVSI